MNCLNATHDLIISSNLECLEQTNETENFSFSKCLKPVDYLNTNETEFPSISNYPEKDFNFKEQTQLDLKLMINYNQMTTNFHLRELGALNLANFKQEINESLQIDNKQLILLKWHDDKELRELNSQVEFEEAISLHYKKNKNEMVIYVYLDMPVEFRNQNFQRRGARRWPNGWKKLQVQRTDNHKL